MKPYKQPKIDGLTIVLSASTAQGYWFWKAIISRRPDSVLCESPPFPFRQAAVSDAELFISTLDPNLEVTRSYDDETPPKPSAKDALPVNQTRSNQTRSNQTKTTQVSGSRPRRKVGV